MRDFLSILERMALNVMYSVQRTSHLRLSVRPFTYPSKVACVRFLRKDDENEELEQKINVRKLQVEATPTTKNFPQM